MEIKLDAQIIRQAELLRSLHGLTDKQAGQAYAKALNDTGFQIRRAMQDEMKAVFDKPTDYIVRSPRVRMAKVNNLSVTIEPAYMGGKGVDPKKVLNAQTWGGKRNDKRSEIALKRVGILPNGMQTAIPSGPFPGSHDGRGNLKGSFLVQLITYFQAAGEQGYKANMTDKRKRSIHKGTHKTFGRRYFVAYGGMKGGARMTARGDYDERASNLAPGIWASSGDGGKDIDPVLMFVKTGGYSIRLDMDKVAKRADADAYLARRIRFRIREAAGV